MLLHDVSVNTLSDQFHCFIVISYKAGISKQKKCLLSFRCLDFTLNQYHFQKMLFVSFEL